MIDRQSCWYDRVCTLSDCSGCIRYSEMKYLMEHSDVPKNQQRPMKLDSRYDASVFDFLDSIRHDIVNFVNGGESLYLFSQTTGNGKTSWAIRLLLRYFDQIWAGNGFRIRGKFVYVPLFLDNIKNFDNPLLKTEKEILSKVDLVVWDDIASVKLSDYDRGQLLSIIDQRVLDGKANIYTGNIITRSAMEDILGSRLASRIWNISTLVEFHGKDRRVE